MIQVTHHMRILVCVEPADFRRGIDGLAAMCRQVLKKDPFSGSIFVFRNRKKTAIKCLAYDGQGFWLMHKRLSKGRFRYWPSGPETPVSQLEAHQLHVLIFGGDPFSTRTSPNWRPLSVCA